MHEKSTAHTTPDLTAERTFRLDNGLPGYRPLVVTCALADLPNRVRHLLDPASTGTEVEVSADGSTATVLNPDGTTGFTFTVTGTDPRRAAFDLAAAGVAAGLPIPRSIGVGDGLSHGRLDLHLCGNDTAGVDRWAAWLGLPAPAMTLTPMSTSTREHTTGWFQPYEAEGPHRQVAGRRVTVKTYVTVPAPADAEQTAVTR